MTQHFTHRVQQTSIESFYEELPDLGRRQYEVLCAIAVLNKDYKINPTDCEIAKYLQYADPNKVRPRRYELEKAELIMDVGNKTCSVTGKTAKSWTITPLLSEKARKALLKMGEEPTETTITLSTDRYELTQKVKVEA